MKDWSRGGVLARSASAGIELASDIVLQPLGEEELEEVVLKIEKEIEGDLTRSGPHRRNAWENGWAESLANFQHKSDEKSLVPGYFENSNVIRLNDRLFRVASGQAEADLLAFLVDLVVESCRQLYGFDNIHEFGCGTGIHVRRMAHRYSVSTVTGYDWATASQQLLNAISETDGLANLKARHFDFFNPDSSVEVGNRDVILTVAALEQTGSDFQPFLDTVLAKRPSLVIHIEPIEELLDTTSRLGQLSAEYFRKRNYLQGYFQALIEMQHEAKIRLLHSGRSGVGSFFIEGYSVVIWQPFEQGLSDVSVS